MGDGADFAGSAFRSLQDCEILGLGEEKLTRPLFLVIFRRFRKNALCRVCWWLGA